FRFTHCTGVRTMRRNCKKCDRENYMLHSKMIGAIAIAASLASSAIAAAPAAGVAVPKSAAVLTLVPGKARVNTVATKKNNILGLPLLAVLAAAAAVAAVAVVATNS